MPQHRTDCPPRSDRWARRAPMSRHARRCRRDASRRQCSRRLLRTELSGTPHLAGRGRSRTPTEEWRHSARAQPRPVRAGLRVVPCSLCRGWSDRAKSTCSPMRDDVQNVHVPQRERGEGICDLLHAVAIRPQHDQSGARFEAGDKARQIGNLRIDEDDFAGARRSWRCGKRPNDGQRRAVTGVSRRFHTQFSRKRQAGSTRRRRAGVRPCG